jgi:hypothetical protein
MSFSTLCPANERVILVEKVFIYVGRPITECYKPNYMR